MPAPMDHSHFKLLVALLLVALVALLGLGAQQLTRTQPDPSPPASPTAEDDPAVAGTVESTPPVSAKETTMPTREDRAEVARPTPEPTALQAVPDQRVEKLMRTMSLEEKVGQLFLVFFEGPVLSPALREMILDYHIGGIVFFSIAGNVENTRQVAQLINDAQATAVNGDGTPLFVAVDQEGGPVVRLTTGFTVFPSQMALGAIDSTDAVAQVARVRARELKALGFNMVLAPVLDVNSNPNNPVIGLRSFGSAPDRVAALGAAMIQAYRQEGLLATAKHFPGHGDTGVDSHTTLPVVNHPLAHLEQMELVPFQAAIAADVPAIMTAHLLLTAIDPARPATLSPAVLEDLLRRKMGFDGLIVTDSLTMGALKLTTGTAESAQMALAAGADVLAFGADRGASPAEQKAAYQRILELVRSGEIPRQRLDDAVERILRAKAEYGLLDWRPTELNGIAARVDTADHQAVLQQVAQESITLVRDDARLLPLPQEGPLLVVWPDAAGDLGTALASCRPNLVRRPVPLSPTAEDVARIQADAADASGVVVATLNARAFPAQVELLEALADGPLVVAALDQPYDLMAFPWVATYLATYGRLPASLDALARVLCGEIEPAGTLPVELPGLLPSSR